MKSSTCWAACSGWQPSARRLPCADPLSSAGRIPLDQLEPQVERRAPGTVALAACQHEFGGQAAYARSVHMHGGQRRQQVGREIGIAEARDGQVHGHAQRSEEHTSELQSPCNIVCRLLLEKKHKTRTSYSALSGRAASRPSRIYLLRL